MAEESLKNKTVKGVAWSGIDNVVQFAVTFCVSLVLARLLTPDDYGIIGIIAIFTNVCNTLIDGGFGDALIRKKSPTDDDYNTAFIVNILTSIVLYGVIFVCAPVIAHFFGRDELIELTRVSSISIIIGAVSFVQMKRLTKRIDFKSQTKITLIASVTSGFIGIIMALMGFGVWSLVVHGLIRQSLRSVFLWFYNKWTPRFRFSKKSFHELFGFGWKMLLTGILDSAWKELYQVVVGKFYSPASLGQYTRANEFSQLFSNNLTGVIQRVTFPVLSDIQDDKPRMYRVYRHIIKTTMFITAISMFFLGAVSESLLYCLIGPQWHDASMYLSIICIYGSLYPLHAINLNMLMVQGRSDIFLTLEIVKKILAIGPLAVGMLWGILPMLYINIFFGIICFFLNTYYTGKLIGYSSWLQVKDIIPSYGVATIVAASVFLFKYLPMSNWIILPIQITVGMSVFFFVCKSFHLEEYEETKQLITPVFNKLKNKIERE